MAAMIRLITSATLVAALLSGASCTETTFEQDPTSEAGTVWPDGGYTPTSPCTPGKDTDGDKIPDEKEGCNPDQDTDGDKVPDYADLDSDGDKVPDYLESKGDSDGDKRPDYKDKDSDGDGIEDGDEDLNWDGKFGCCFDKCGESRKGCPPTKPGACGLCQTCKGGACTPKASFLCSNGETDPKKKSTYGGTGDKALPTFICRKAGEMGGKGLKEVDFKTSSEGTWKVALEKGAGYGALKLSGNPAKGAAGAFDYKGGNQIVAGFVLSRASSGADVTVLSAKVITDLKSKLSGASSVLTVSSGNKVTSHDKFPTVVSTQLAVTASAGKTVGAMRNGVVSALLGAGSGNGGPSGYGSSTTGFTIKFATQLRKDGRIIVMGAVGITKMANDPKQATGYLMEDLSNGSGLATLSDSGTVECDPFILSRNPVADIIWVVDESGSMSDNLQDIVNNANDFFSRAVKSGLDFRMGVTGVADPNDFNPFQPKVIVGKMCGKLMPAPMFDMGDPGGPDRFLSANEQKIFKSCVANPPYREGSSEYGLAHAYEGVTRHLPRKAGDNTKIRPNASLAIIIATDEAPKELKGGKYKGQGPSYKANGCSLTATSQAEVNKYLGPWFTRFGGKDPKWGSPARAMVHLIGGLCGSSGGSSSCSAEVGHGYLELVKATGGIAADICQKNLGTTLQIIIDAITGAASPAVLQYVPISASLAVALDNKQLKRSRASGFDYVGFSNSLVFVGVKIPKGSKVVASYRRWVKQATVK